MLVLRPLLGGGLNDGFDPLDFNEASLVAQTVKNLPAMRETWLQSLSREDPLEKEMTTTPLFMPGEFHGQRSLMAKVLRSTKSRT